MDAITQHGKERWAIMAEPHSLQRKEMRGIKAAYGPSLFRDVQLGVVTIPFSVIIIEDVMDATDLARIVQEMRNAQKEYFRVPNQSTLVEAKRQEKKVDRCLEHLLSGQGRLFEERE